jgi:hypothetical protein
VADLGEGRDGWQRFDGIKEEGGWVGDEMHHGLDVMGTRCEPARREPCATGSFASTIVRYYVSRDTQT